MNTFDEEKSYIVTETDGSVTNQVALRNGTMAQEGQIISGASILCHKIQGPCLLKDERIEEMVKKKGKTGLVRASEASKKKGGKQ